MAYKIEDIEGIGPAFGAKLREAGIKNTDQLLDACSDAKGRKAIEERTGVAHKNLLTWVNLADLMRISGIGPQFSELLEAAGVDTVKELRNRNAENLAAKMAEVNEEKHLTRMAPAMKTVARWVEAAKAMEPRISH